MTPHGLFALPLGLAALVAGEAQVEMGRPDVHGEIADVSSVARLVRFAALSSTGLSSTLAPIPGALLLGAIIRGDIMEVVEMVDEPLYVVGFQEELAEARRRVQ
jgi:hypothetical protein